MTTTYLLDDMSGFLAAAGLGLTEMVNLYASMLPDAPDMVVTLFEYAGLPPEYVMGADNPLPAISRPDLQVVARDVSYPAARATCEGATRALETICNQTINGTYYERVERNQDPFFMKRDSVRNRVYFVCNFSVMRSPS